MASAKQDKTVNDFDVVIQNLNRLKEYWEAMHEEIQKKLNDGMTMLFASPDRKQELQEAAPQYRAAVSGATKRIATIVKMKTNEPITQEELDHLRQQEEVTQFSCINDYKNIAAPTASAAAAP